MKNFGCENPSQNAGIQEKKYKQVLVVNIQCKMLKYQKNHYKILTNQKTIHFHQDEFKEYKDMNILC